MRKLWSLGTIVILGAFAIAACAVPGSGGGNGAGGTGPAAVNLGSAGNYVILAQSAISNTPTSAVTGDIGLSPAATSFITGFGTLVATSASQTSPQVTGNIFAADMVAPTPTALTSAIGAMGTAYTDAAGRVAGVGPNLNLGAGTIPPSTTLAPGTYTWGSSVSMPNDVTLSGGAKDTWLFQMTGNLSTASTVKIILSGGALPQNIVWQVAGSVALGATSQFQGIILCKTAIALGTGSTVNGRLYAQTAVTLTGTNTVTKP